MYIKHLATLAGPYGIYQAGVEREAPEAEAQALIAGGYAIALHPRQPEHAVKTAPEHAITPRRTRKPAPPTE